MKPANGRNIFKLGIIVISTGVITTVSLIAWDALGNGMTVVADPPTPTPIIKATTLPTITLNVPLILVVKDGQIVFYDQPDGMPDPHVIPTGTLLDVIVREERNVGGTEWFLLEVTEVGVGGWVQASELLDIKVGPAHAFDNFQFCLGTAASPTGPCGSSLPLAENEIWLTYRFKGLERGAVLQTVVVVNGEQYQSAPQVWEGSPAGTQLVPLVRNHNLPHVPGLWTVKFYVDNEYVAESSVQVRP